MSFRGASRGRGGSFGGSRGGSSFGGRGGKEILTQRFAIELTDSVRRSKWIPAIIWPTRISAWSVSPLLCIWTSLIWTEMGSFVHACEGEMVCESVNPKIPYFNAPIYLENKVQTPEI